MPWWSPSPAPPPGRPPPVVQATVVSVASSGSQPAAGSAGLALAGGETAAKAALPSPPRPPSVHEEPIPEAPTSFPSLERLSIDEMRNLKANELIMDDWILELPQVHWRRDSRPLSGS